MGNAGGFVGEIDESAIRNARLNVRFTLDPRLTFINELRRTAGLTGYTDEETFVDGIDARVFMDLTLNGTGTNNSANGGLMGEWTDGSSLTNTTALLDITLRSPANGDAKTIRDFGGMLGHPEEFAAAGVDVRGTITIDTRASSVPVTVSDVGGAFGRTRAYPTMLADGHIDVDILILGRDAVVSNVGALVGRAQRFSVADVRVGGRIHVDGSGSKIGALVGEYEHVTTIYRTFSGVIYRGEGVRVGDDSTNIGTLWGFQDTGLVQGASVF